MSEIDHELEAAIERSGPERVMERAYSIGWGGANGMPPKWVWWMICHELGPQEKEGPEPKP